MEILVNGKPVSTSAHTIAELLLELGLSQELQGIAIALNEEIVRKTEFNRMQIQAGDQIEIIHARQGG